MGTCRRILFADNNIDIEVISLYMKACLKYCIVWCVYIHVYVTRSEKTDHFAIRPKALPMSHSRDFAISMP